MTLGIVQLEALIFILARIAGVFIQAPLFSTRSFAMSAKAALAIWISLVLWFVTPAVFSPNLGFLALVLTIINEAAIGFAIGFICNLLFIAIQSGGEIIDMQMGLSVSQALDPVFGSVISIIGRLSFYLALTVFIIFDGHHLILSAFHQSFTLLPLGKFANFASPNLALILMDATAKLWLTAINLAAPIVLLIFITDFSFGIVSRVAPQVNVFMLGFQVKPFIGLLGILFTAPFLIKYIGKLVAIMGQEMVRLLMILK